MVFGLTAPKCWLFEVVLVAAVTAMIFKSIQVRIPFADASTCELKPAPSEAP
jgi:hypothetical protein